MSGPMLSWSVDGLSHDNFQRLSDSFCHRSLSTVLLKWIRPHGKAQVYGEWYAQLEFYARLTRVFGLLSHITDHRAANIAFDAFVSVNMDQSIVVAARVHPWAALRIVDVISG